MSQSTKLFVVVGFMFILYTTMNGHLEQYLKVLFSKSGNSGGSKSVEGVSVGPLTLDTNAALSTALRGIGFNF